MGVPLLLGQTFLASTWFESWLHFRELAPFYHQSHPSGKLKGFPNDWHWRWSPTNRLIMTPEQWRLMYEFGDWLQFTFRSEPAQVLCATGSDAQCWLCLNIHFEGWPCRKPNHNRRPRPLGEPVANFVLHASCEILIELTWCALRFQGLASVCQAPFKNTSQHHLFHTMSFLSPMLEALCNTGPTLTTSERHSAFQKL